MPQQYLNHHIYHWIEKIEANIVSFNLTNRITNKQRVEFITHQYHLVMLIHRALDGTVRFVGANPVHVDDIPASIEQLPISNVSASDN